MGVSTTKDSYKNVYLKGFVFSDGERTTSWGRVKDALEVGKNVEMNVHVTGYGDWKTSPIKGITYSRGKKIVETNSHFYQIVGRVSSKKVKEIQVSILSENKILSTKRREDVNKLSEYVKNGCKLKAKIFRMDGGMNLTSPIVEVNTFLRRITTETGSVYRW